MTQPSCDDLPSTPLPPVYEGPRHPSLPAWGMWLAVAIAVAAFEWWAMSTGHETMSEAVRHGPRWAQWLIGGGLVFLLWHLFVQK